METGLLLLRLTAGLTLAAHGAQKLFGWFGGPGLEATGQFFETIGFLPGRRHALMAGLAETGGGVLLALGLLTPIGARSEEHTSELQSLRHLVCRLLLEKKKKHMPTRACRAQTRLFLGSSRHPSRP